MPKKTGRPEKSKSEYKGDTVGTRLNAVASERMKKAVKITGLLESGFVREAVIEKTNKVLGNARNKQTNL